MTHSPSQSLSLDDLIAFNDELAALVRAGVPLGEGLTSLGDDLPSGLARISRTMAERMEQGQSLPDALAATGDQFPPLYRALVTAGIRAGRLPAALEQLSVAARRIATLRRLILSSFVYPVIVLLLGYGMFLFFIVRIAPVLNASAPVATLEQPPASVRMLASLKTGVQWWGPILPTIVVMVLIVWWLRSRRAMVLQPATAGLVLGMFAPVRQLLLESQAAGLAEMLALLIEHQMPMPEALVLAAEATGDKDLIASTKKVAAEIAAGGRPADDNQTKRRPTGSIPPLLHWLIAAGAGQPNLAAMLRQNAHMYHRRAVARTDWLRWRLPVILTIAIGGTATLIYALMLFVPWISMLKQLTP